MRGMSTRQCKRTNDEMHKEDCLSTNALSMFMPTWQHVMTAVATNQQWHIPDSLNVRQNLLPVFDKR